ncbi:MAG: hypothetical protein OEY24_01080 [Candidatus Bathyarchaeota archaeon]|nr:hypothetical protein [Candidatus Bathyarchaeota archaeon]MDH5494286.1 hypothetical protein [Candidatus Bathyarchaeota archaeon]
MSEGKITVSRNCREAVDRLHETMKLLDLSQIDLAHKEKRYVIVVAIFSLWIGFAIADFVSAATVVYSVGPVTGMKPEYVFWNPEGGIFISFTWFGLGLIVSIVFSLISLCYSVVCSFSRRAARRELKDLNVKLKEAKSVIVEVCPMELWYSGEA